MNKPSVFNISILIVVLVFGILSYQQSAAQAQELFRVIPFSTAGGHVGFFNNQDGRVYLYDDNLENCVYIAQVEKLGEPLKLIKSPRSDKKIHK